MKDFMKKLSIAGAAFAIGYLYSEYKAGRDFEIDNELFSFKMKTSKDLDLDTMASQAVQAAKDALNIESPSKSMIESIEEKIDDLTDN